MHKETSNIKLPEQQVWMFSFWYILTQNCSYIILIKFKVSHLYNYINLVNQGLRPAGALHLHHPFRPQLCALAQKSHTNINTACLVTTNNGLKQHQMVSFEPKVCFFFSFMQFLVFWLAFFRCEEVLGGRGKGLWWLGPNDVPDASFGP